MDSESERVYDRMRLYKLSQAHPEWKSPQLAQEVGRSERWVRKWLVRFRETGDKNVQMFQSQSRRPKERPRQTSDEVKDIICEWREHLTEQYHRPAGAGLIQTHLKEDERLQDGKRFVPRSSRTITRVLRERGYIQDRQERQRMPLELVPPMEEWEMDFCEIRLEDGRFEFFLVVDRGTSRVVYLEGSEGYRAESALLAVARLFALNGLPKRLRFDRDPRLVWSWSADSFPAPFIRLLHALNVEPVICPPRRPDKKPYVERCIRTFKHEWLDRFSLNTMADVYEALNAFPHYHNAQRRHFGRACAGKTPDEAFPQLPILPALPDGVNPNRWCEVEHGRTFRRRIRANGTIQVDKHVYYIDEKLARQSALVHLNGYHKRFLITVNGKLLPKPLAIKDILPDQLDLQAYLKVLQEEARSIADYRRMVWMKTGEAA